MQSAVQSFIYSHMCRADTHIFEGFSRPQTSTTTNLWAALIKYTNKCEKFPINNNEIEVFRSSWLSQGIKWWNLSNWYRICIKQTKEMFNDSQIQMSICFALPFPIKAIEDTNSREMVFKWFSIRGGSGKPLSPRTIALTACLDTFSCNSSNVLGTLNIYFVWPYISRRLKSYFSYWVGVWNAPLQTALTLSSIYMLMELQ